MIKSIKLLWAHIELFRKKQFLILILLIISASLAEIISLGALIPFLGFLTSPDQFINNTFVKFINEVLNISDEDKTIIPITIIFIVAALSAGALRFFLICYQSRLTHSIGSDLSINIFRRTLYLAYEVHFQKNSSEVVSGILSKLMTIIYQVLLPIITVISSIVILLAVLSTLFYINAQVAVLALSGFTIIYIVVAFFTKKRISKNGNIISSKQDELVKHLQESLGGIRDILINGNQETYTYLYSEADRPLRKAQAEIFIMSACPRYIIEAIAMSFLALLTIFLSLKGSGLINSIPVLGALALGAQRMLPLLQQVYYGWSTIKGAQKQLDATLSLLEQPLPLEGLLGKDKKIKFENDIRFVDVSFKYSSVSVQTLKNINLQIKQGERIGIIGKTGSGKSTFADIFMGLIKPNKGKILIDNLPLSSKNINSWQSVLSHVPQNIFLTDSSIAENIALGIPKEKINMKLLMEVVKKSQLTETINSLEKKFDTIVGERGARLSGGQIQRIGIARALYKKPKILVFDEATSALDLDTANEIMETIRSLGDQITIIIIAHRKSLLKSCSKLIEISEAEIKEIKKK